MPITEMSFYDGIFYAREEGVITDVDAQAWADAMQAWAETSPTPIVGLVDARGVTSVTRNAGVILAAASRHPNLFLSAVATDDPRLALTSQTIGAQGKRGGTHIFNSIDEARVFAYEQVSFLNNANRSVGR